LIAGLQKYKKNDTGPYQKYIQIQQGDSEEEGFRIEKADDWKIEENHSYQEQTDSAFCP